MDQVCHTEDLITHQLNNIGHEWLAGLQWGTEVKEVAFPAS